MKSSKVPFYLLWILLTSPENLSALEQTDFSMLSELLQQFIRSYVKDLNIFQDFQKRPILKLGEDSEIKDIINKKVEELKSYLQDDEYSKVKHDLDDVLTLEGGDKTTIIELVPKSNPSYRVKKKNAELFKENIKKYKKLRNKIKTKLSKEFVSIKTNKLVIGTLDNMLTQIMRNQCTWNVHGAADEKYVLKTGKINKTDPMVLANTWGQQWHALKKQYSNSLIPKDNTPFFDQFDEFFTSIVSDLQKLSKEKKIFCKIINGEDANNHHFMDVSRMGANNPKSTNIKEDFKKTHYTKDTCGNFKICSQELTEFMNYFYKKLNKTVLNTLSNYVAMYLRDVNEDSRHEKKTVIYLLNNTADIVQMKISKIFKKQTLKLKLDKDKKNKANIKALNNYVQKTFKSIKKQANLALEENLKSLRVKLLLNIVKDLNVNLNVELGNLEKELGVLICTFFQVCNSQYNMAGRQINSEPSIRSDSNPNDVYVKMQFTFDDDDITDSLKYLHARKQGINPIDRNIINRANNENENKYARLDITRTTLYMATSSTAPKLLKGTTPSSTNSSLLVY